MVGLPWTEEEKQILLDMYDHAPIKEIQRRLPNRTYEAITSFARKRLNLSRSRWLYRTKYCLVCGIELTSENTYVSSFKSAYHICKKCHQRKGKKWADANREKTRTFVQNWWKKNPYYRKEYMRKNAGKIREYSRNHTLTTTVNGKQVRLCGITKRPRPLACELCGHLGFLTYHHWKIEGTDVYGIWICRRCHAFVERYEKGFADKYFKLKEQVNKELVKVVI